MQKFSFIHLKTSMQVVDAGLKEIGKSIKLTKCLKHHIKKLKVWMRKVNFHL